MDAAQDREDNGCPDCGSGYYQSQGQGQGQQGEMSGAQKFSMIMSAITPTIGMGLNTWSNLSSMKGIMALTIITFPNAPQSGCPAAALPATYPLIHGLRKRKLRWPWNDGHDGFWHGHILRYGHDEFTVWE